MNPRLEPEWHVPTSPSIQSEQGCCLSAIRIINRKQQKSKNNTKKKLLKHAKSTTLEISLAKGLLHAIADYNEDEPSVFVRIE